MIKYLGSKRTLIPWIIDATSHIGKFKSILDVFSGTSRVGHAFKRAGYQVTANDHNAYGATLARCYVESDSENVLARATKLIAELNRIRGRDGYFTQTFCRDSRFFQPMNGERVDAIRDAIEAKCLPPDLKAVLLVSLMEAADRVDSTVGVQMAFLKQWASRSSNAIELRMPDILPRARHGAGRATQLDANRFAQIHSADVAYLDPPYNQHKYVGNYHIWETLVLWDSPATYGVACKRIDCRDRSSDFNSKNRFESAFRSLISQIDCRALMVSFSDEGFLDRQSLEEILRTRGEVRVLARPYNRYVGARIGIHNPAGERVGQIGKLRNTEYLFVAGKLKSHPTIEESLAS